MNIKRTVQSITDKFTNKVDKKLIEYISRYISDDMSVLEKAVSIYLCLGDVLHYSPHFALTNDYGKLSLPCEISLENSEMICKSWSHLYHRLLKHFGIDSKIVRKRTHYKVEMVLDNVIYSMDGTCYGGTGFYYSMSDTARIKFGFKIERFMVAGTVDPYDINKYKSAIDKLDTAIDSIYKRQNRKVIPGKRAIDMKNRIVDRVQTHGREVGVGTLDDINYRLKIINRFWGLNITESPLEKVQLFNTFFRYLFEDYEDYDYETKSYNVFGYENHKLKIFKLIAIEVNGEYYYFFDDGKKFHLYDRKQVIEEFWKRNMRITEFTEVLGIYTGLEVYKIRMK